MGHDNIHHDHIGHTYTGQNHIDRDYIHLISQGHNYMRYNAKSHNTIQPGTVTEITERGPRVQKDGYKSAYYWDECRPLVAMTRCIITI